MSRPSVGWIGLGAMGGGMAACLARKGFQVKAYDVWKPSVEAAVKAGCNAASTPADAASGVQVLALMVVNAAQVEEVLLGPAGVADILEDGASIICFSTVPPSFLRKIQTRLDALQKRIGICDSPVSGGSSRAADGTLAIMTSGVDAAIATAKPVLDALTSPAPGALSIVGKEVGIASDFKLINQVLCATQICVVGEALAFAKSMGLNLRMLMNVLSTAAGTSFMFGHRSPWLLRPNASPLSAMTIVAKDSGIVMDEARSLGFPMAVSAAVEQLVTAGLGAGLGREDDSRISLLWERSFGVPRLEEEGSEENEVEAATELDIPTAPGYDQILFIGLGLMGLPMALSLQRKGFTVHGFDTNDSARHAFAKAGGHSVEALTEIRGSNVVYLMTNTAEQAEEVLFGVGAESGLARVLPREAVIIIGSTIAPSAAERIAKALAALNSDVKLVDAPVSGGPSRAVEADLAIFASGETLALSRASATLKALSQQKTPANLHFLPGGTGTGSKVKLVNNLLSAVHLCSAAEGLTLAAKKGMHLPTVFDVLKGGAASSYMLTDRGPRMFEAKPAIHAALHTLAKDLVLVIAEGKRTSCPLFITSAAQTYFTRALGLGWGHADDSCISKLWKEQGVSISV